MTFSRGKIFLLVLVTALLVGPYFNLNLKAQNLEEKCQWSKIKDKPSSMSHGDYESLLRECQDFFQNKSQKFEENAQEAAQKKNTLQSKIQTLNNKIKNLDYKIYQSNIMVRDLKRQIEETKSSIQTNSEKIEEMKTTLRGLLQLRYERDRSSLVEILLKNKNLSSFFDKLINLKILNNKISNFLKEIEDLKSTLQDRKEKMSKEKKQLENTVAVRKIQKKENKDKKQEQQYFLNLTEQEYQEYLQKKKQAQQKASEIDNLLFELLEVPEGGIKFKDAVQVAKQASSKTGVRPAFSLAVLWQETRIGKVEGGCYLRNFNTGDGVYIKTGNSAPNTMKPSRDVQPFLNIVKELNQKGRLNTDAKHTSVSCAMLGNNGEVIPYWWGGAMGPAQFIPSTWNAYDEKIEKITGRSYANPWNVKDAFLANSLHLKRLGAARRGYESEISAALNYFGCSSCRDSYGEPVMEAARCIQSYMNNGKMSTGCRDLVF